MRRLGRRYWTLWTSSATANLGDGIFQVAVALAAVKLTRSPALVAGVALAARLPWLFVALPAGALADRLDRRQTMLRANVARVVLISALAIAIATETATIALLYVISVGLGVAEVLFDTSSQTLMPAVVDKDDLPTANGRLFAVELVMNQFVGPPLGGLLVAVSAAVAMGAGAGLYAFAAVALALLPGTYRTVRDAAVKTTLRADVGEGLRYLFNHRLLRTLGLLLGAQNLLATAHGALFVLYATSNRDGLGLSDAGVGLLLAVSAFGAFLGSLAAGPIERRLGRTNVLTVSIVSFGLALLVPGLTTNVAIVAASGSLAGSAALWNVITVSLRQRIIPDHLLGRVNSAYRLLGWGSMPLGAAAGGALAEVLSVRAVFLVAGALVLLQVIPLRLVITDRVISDAEADTVPRMALQGDYEPSPWEWVRNQVDEYESSGGTRGNTLRDTGLPVIIVTTRGAKTGKIRKTPLMKVEHGGEYALVASMGGAPKHPVWYFNLKADPDSVLVQDGPAPFAVDVRELDGEERDIWWQRAVDAFPPYAEYQEKTDRTIPVFLASRRG